MSSPSDMPPKPSTFSLVIAGFGVEATPKLPVGVAHLEDGSLIVGPASTEQVKARGGSVKNVMLKPGKPPSGALEKRTKPGAAFATYSTSEDGTTLLALGVGMESYEPVLESYRTADQPAHWTIVTSDYEIRWPAKFTLRADGDMSPRSWPYELALDGSRDNLVWLQGPLRGKQIPTPEQLVAPGMEIAARGEINGTSGAVRWIELAYEHQGTKWRQRAYWLPVDADARYVLRAQGTTDVTAATVFPAADLIATSFRPRPPSVSTRP